MVLNEIVWKIVPPELEGAGWFAARLRAEVEIRKLLLEIKQLRDEVAALKPEPERDAQEEVNDAIGAPSRLRTGPEPLPRTESGPLVIQGFKADWMDL